jgi:ABC-type Fe3+ transport system permease subunit
MFLLAVPTRDPSALALVVLVMAACCAAAFQRHWILQRGTVTLKRHRSRQ